MYNCSKLHEFELHLISSSTSRRKYIALIRAPFPFSTTVSRKSKIELLQDIYRFQLILIRKFVLPNALHVIPTLTPVEICFVI